MILKIDHQQDVHVHLVGYVTHREEIYEVRWPGSGDSSEGLEAPATIHRDSCTDYTFRPPAGGPFEDAADVLCWVNKLVTEGIFERGVVKSAAKTIAACWPNGRGVRKEDAILLARALDEQGLLTEDGLGEGR